MAEDSRLLVVCQDCVTTFRRKTTIGVPPKRCPDCRKAARRLISAGTKRRAKLGVKATPTFTCVDCNVTRRRPHMDGQIPKRCDPCRKEAGRARTRRRTAAKSEQAKDRFEQLGRLGSCSDCGGTISAKHQKSRLPQRCPDCREAQEKIKARLRLDKLKANRPGRPDFPCADCGDLTRQNPIGKFSTRCQPCRLTFNLSEARRRISENPERARASNHARRARRRGVGFETFGPKEIFERDGWRCGICRKRIAKRLRHPNPMSASLDHKVPLSKGGHHSRSNVQASHLRCNLRKRTAVAPLGEQIPLPI